jgi:hypothetical protein
MTMMMMPSRKHSNQIHRQSQRADYKKLIRVHDRRVDQSLNSFKDDEDRNKDQEDSVGET